MASLSVLGFVLVTSVFYVAKIDGASFINGESSKESIDWLNDLDNLEDDSYYEELFLKEEDQKPKYDCDFELPCEQWSNLNANRGYNSTWKLHNGTTPTPETGPSMDNTLGSAAGHYIYLDSSVAGPVNVGLEIKDSFFGAICLAFKYHMYGQTMGTLNVKLDPGSEVVWSRSGDQGNKWYQAAVPVTRSRGFKFIIEGIKGSGDSSDMAIDDIKVRPGDCAAFPTEPPPTTTESPVTTTEATTATTEASTTITEALTTSTEASTSTTEAPAITTEAPTTTTEAPTTTTEASNSTTETLTTTTEVPVTTTEVPTTTTESSTATTDGPATTTEAPVTTSEGSTSPTEVSTTTTKSPATTIPPLPPNAVNFSNFNFNDSNGWSGLANSPPVGGFALLKRGMWKVFNLKSGQKCIQLKVKTLRFRMPILVLRVITLDSGQQKPIKTLRANRRRVAYLLVKGYKGNYFHTVTRRFGVSSGSFRIAFQAYRGQFQLDDIGIYEGNCPDPADVIVISPQDNYNCSFSQSHCGFSPALTVWPTFRAYQRGLFTRYSYAVMRSPFFRSSNETCLKLSYRFYGCRRRNSIKLGIFVKEYSMTPFRRVWLADCTNGQALPGKIDLPSYNNVFKLKFVGVIRRQRRRPARIEIKQLSLTSGSCGATVSPPACQENPLCDKLKIFCRFSEFSKRCPKTCGKCS